MALLRSGGAGAVRAAMVEDAARMELLGRAVEWLAGHTAGGVPDTAATAYLQVSPPSAPQRLPARACVAPVVRAQL